MTVETKTLTLTEFLLARIADDEAWAQARWEPSVTRSGADTAVSIRLRKECEAKRRIVELHPLRRFIPTPNTWDARDVCPTCHGHGYPCDTLRHLATVYADHPDFDEAWRA